jgi:hypothetical protein
MTSLDKSPLKPTKIEIIGNRHINRVTGMEVDHEDIPSQVVFNSFSTPPHKNSEADDDNQLFPSDHFGLLAEFTLNDEEV